MEHSKENIVDYLMANAAAFPTRTVFTILGYEEHSENRISYLELKLKVEILSGRLIGRKLEGKRVLLVYTDIEEFIVSFLACTYLGIIPVPVSYVTGKKRQATFISIIKDVQGSAIFCTSHSEDNLRQALSGHPELNGTAVVVTDHDYTADASDFPAKRSYNEIAFIQYTSGSAGNPKGVVITAGNLLHNQQLIRNTFSCNEDSVIFSWLPFHHDMGLIGNILHTIYTGSACILMSPLHFIQAPHKWLSGISKYKVTHSGGPNFAYDLCISKISQSELFKIDLSSWKVAYNGSEPLRSETIQRFSDYFQPTGFRQSSFYPCYGLAEATLLVSGKNNSLPPLMISVQNDVGTNKLFLADTTVQTKLIVSSGKVATGMEVKIIGVQDQHECIELTEGEICISGSSVTSGYWNKNNNDTFYHLDGKLFLKTGDLGFLYQNELFLHGRIKEMLVVRGQNIYPYDMEQMIFETVHSIEPNGVVIFNIGESEEDIVVAAEIKRVLLKDINAEDVIDSIDKVLNGSFGINPFDVLLTTPLGIPRTTSGKLQRLKCGEKYQRNAFNIIGSKLALSKKIQRKQQNKVLLDEIIREISYNSLKAYLVDIIRSKATYLQAALLDDTTDLTEAGIDSLKAMEIMNTINKDLNINLDATKVFRDNTLRGLINIIECMLWLKNEQTSGKEITI